MRMMVTLELEVKVSRGRCSANEVFAAVRDQLDEVGADGRGEVGLPVAA